MGERRLVVLTALPADPACLWCKGKPRAPWRCGCGRPVEEPVGLMDVVDALRDPMVLRAVLRELGDQPLIEALQGSAELQLAAEAALARAREPEACTGLAASWCPRCGACSCPELPSGERTLTDDGCPLHASTSPHAEDADG